MIVLLSPFIIYGQDMPKLAILPFTGIGGSDGETIAMLLGNQVELRSAFTTVSRTSNVEAVLRESEFQRSGITDSDRISELGKQMNADYVVAGHIQQLGESRIISISIIDVESLQQIAGDYKEYTDIAQIREYLPEMVSRVAASSQQDSTRLPRLAVTPFNIITGTANERDAELLAQLLAIEIANSGRFAVLPRTSTIQRVFDEHTIQRSGITDPANIRRIGNAVNADYVLAGNISALGQMNLFLAQIINVETGEILAGGDEEYRQIADGLVKMKTLATTLISASSSLYIQSQASATESTSNSRNNSRFWSIGLSAGTAFNAPWVIASLHGTIAPFPYSFLELGVDFGMISGDTDAEFYYSVYPFAHIAFFLPLNEIFHFYAGAGCGYMLGEYTFPEEKIPVNIPAYDLTAGINLFNMIKISYTVRTNFISASNKLSIGFFYRF